MLDQERIFSVLELLNLLNQSNKIASKLLQSYYRSKKLIGSKDRRFISKSFWNIIRHRYKINWHLNYLDIEKVIKFSGASAVALASMLHYGAIKDLIYDRTNIYEGNTSYIQSENTFKSFEQNNIKNIKQQLEGSVSTRI